MNILKPLTVTVLVAPLVLAGCITDPVTGQQSASKTAVYGLGDAAVCGTVDALTHGGKDVHNSAPARGAIGARVGGCTDYQAKKLHESLASTSVKAEQQGNQIELVMPENAIFATSSTTLGANARDALTAVSKTSVQYPDTTLTINSHTDNTDSDTISNPLSRNRAQSVVSSLQSQGVTGSRLTTTGHDPRQPVAPNATPKDHAQNHRVEILVNPSQDAIKMAQQ